MKKTEAKEVCPAAEMLELLGERHILRLIYSLISGSKGFNDLQDEMGVNTATLAKRLNKLEAEQLIEKLACETDSRRHYYALTKRGKKLSKVINLFSKI
jgi:DNA-binding HxlR family transcriptional regulator